ncbi:MAG: HAD family phosphatase [Lachnospiraceae bacterium]|nr:HAD family phosphatase [Lachnospiraceae bacterium]
MKYKLICVDVDGTLLNDEKKVPELVKESLKNASGMGIRIALVTGRMPAGADLAERELSVPCIKVCSAGTYILLGDQCIHTEYMIPRVMREIYTEFALKNGLPLWIFQGRKWYVTDMDTYVKQEIEIIQYEPEIADVEALAQSWEEEGTGPNKLLIAGDPETVRRIEEEMKWMDLPEVDMARSSEHYLEIFPKGVTKGEALAAVCEKLNIRLEETIAFGDQELDVPMIQKAGVGIAMGNAIEDVKAAADYVTRSNNDSGIAYALEQYL